MPRRPDVPCAGRGKLLESTKGALPAGMRTCRPCRAILRARGGQVPGRPRPPCGVCGGPTPLRRSDGRASKRKTCSVSCAVIARASGTRSGLGPGRARPCGDCGTIVTQKPNGAGPLCGPCRSIRRRAHYRRKNATRRGAAPVGRRMSIQELGVRDGWRCHLCCGRVKPSFVAPDPRSATFDHLIPVSRGGNDAPENLALAHWGCNSSRGAGGAVQLLLIG